MKTFDRFSKKVYNKENSNIEGRVSWQLISYYELVYISQNTASIRSRFDARGSVLHRLLPIRKVN